MNSTSRALTLVEVLAATVLLALVAGACASMLRGVAEVLPRNTRAIGADELSVFVDEMLEPREPTRDSEVLLAWIEGGAGEFELARAQPGPPVHVRRLTSDPPEPDHAWLEFSGAGACVWRWVPVEPAMEDQR